MLLTLDMHISGIVRERILVSYHRYGTGQVHGDSSIEDICMLLRSTGFNNAPDSKRVSNYPDEFFRYECAAPFQVAFVNGFLFLGALDSMRHSLK